MTAFSLWISAKHVTVAQASLLLVNIIPERIKADDISLNLENILASKNRLISAILNKDLNAQYIENSSNDVLNFLESYENNITHYTAKIFGDYEFKNIHKLDPNKIQMKIDDVIAWVEKEDLNDNFFVKIKEELAIKRTIQSKRKNIFSKKLYAANKAYSHFTNLVTENPNYVFKESPKKTIINWLEDNSERLGLTREVNGKIIPNELGIEEIAKVVNWDVKGGAKKQLKPTKNK